MANNYFPKFKRSAVITLLAAACCLAAGTHAATLYKWTDENGVTHFTERPPAGVTDVEKVRNHVGRGNSPVEYNSGNDSEQEQAVETQENSGNQPQRDPAVQKARCETAQRNLDSLSSFVRIREKDENGELRFLSEEEVADRRRGFKEVIEKECGGS